MIKIENISKSFGEKQVIEQINFEVQKGELAVIYGTNGAGKSTLIKVITGLISKNNGSIYLDPSNKIEMSLFLGHEMLIPKLKVKEYLAFVGYLKEVNGIDDKIKELSIKLDFESHLNELISNVSFGTKTKVLFASCLLNNPKILIMDEPFIGIDLIVLDELVKILNELKSNGCTIFISSHQVDIIENIIDRVIILKDKKIVLNELVIKLPIQNIGDLPSFIVKELTK